LPKAQEAGLFKLSDDDSKFLAVPPGSVVLSSGANGTEGRIERSQDTVVRIGIQAVAVATSQGGKPCQSRSRPATALRTVETDLARSNSV